jgi:Family of unknown function (DUF6152)
MSLTTHKLAAGALCGVLALISTRPTPAHHSFVMFDLSRQSQVAGTVRNLEWANPHVWLWVIATNENSEAMTYAFEGTSINEMSRRSGWTKNIVTVGEKVTVKYRPFKDGRNGGRIITVTLGNGRVLDADGGYHPPPDLEPAPAK